MDNLDNNTSKEMTFVQTLNELKTLAGEQGGVVSKEQVDELFKTNSLKQDDTNTELVYEYLRENKIGVGTPINPDDYLTEEEASYLDSYLKEIMLLGQVSEGEKEAISLSAMAGDRDAQMKLIEIYLPYVVEIARLYAGQGVFLEDLIGEGNVALTMGVGMLGCLEKSEEVQGMLGKLMMDAMESYIEENVESGKISEKVVKRVNAILDRAKELAEELGRKVTPEEMAEETGLSLKAIQDAVRMSADQIDYIDSKNESR